MSSGRKRFKILTHVGEKYPWPHGWVTRRGLEPTYCPRYVVMKWCEKRKRFRIQEELAVGVPYDPWWRWGKYHKRGLDTEDWELYGQQLADQNNLPWVKTFDPSWKLHDLMLMRLKGKV